MTKERVNVQLNKRRINELEEYEDETGLNRSDSIRDLLDAGHQWNGHECQVKADGGHVHTRSVVGTISENAASMGLVAATFALVISVASAEFSLISEAAALGVVSLLFSAIYVAEVGVDRLTNHFGRVGGQ